MNEEDRAWQDYSAEFRRDVLPKLLDAAVFLALGADVGDFDVQQATQLGAALLYDKPLLLVIPRGRHVSRHLRRAADAIVADWDPRDPDAQARLTAALNELVHP